MGGLQLVVARPGDICELWDTGLIHWIANESTNFRLQQSSHNAIKYRCKSYDRYHITSIVCAAIILPESILA